MYCVSAVDVRGEASLEVHWIALFLPLFCIAVLTCITLDCINLICIAGYEQCVETLYYDIGAKKGPKKSGHG